MQRLKIQIAPNREIRINYGLAVNGGKRSTDVCGSPSPISTEDSDTDHSLLDISSEFQREQEDSAGEVDGSGLKPGWGVLPKHSSFGTEQKRLMLRAGAVCDMRYGLRQVVLTGTLPGNTNEVNYALASWSGYAVNRLLQWARRIVGEAWYFGVWEYQKRGALHFHLAVCYDTEAQAKNLLAGFKPQWIKILCDISERSKIDLFDTGAGFSWSENQEVVQADAQSVRKSCAAYFAKYATKAYWDEVKAGMQGSALERYSPSRWIMVSRAVSRAIKENTFCLEIEGPRGDVEAKLQDWIAELEQFCCKKFAYKWEVVPGETRVYYYNSDDFRSMANRIREEKLRRESGDLSKQEDSQDGSCKAADEAVRASVSRQKSGLQCHPAGQLPCRKADRKGRERVLSPMDGGQLELAI